ncbi:MAG: hypothetical protein N4A45_07805 [Flavobacteriales bacterium]|jgi:hypothetical protein|nr:hypothetical protein [Flavobacteriales bacterium]
MNKFNFHSEGRHLDLNKELKKHFSQSPNCDSNIESKPIHRYEVLNEVISFDHLYAYLIKYDYKPTTIIEEGGAFYNPREVDFLTFAVQDEYFPQDIMEIFNQSGADLPAKLEWDRLQIFLHEKANK